MNTDIVPVNLDELERISQLVERIGARVVPNANPCPSREEFDQIQEFIERLRT